MEINPRHVISLHHPFYWFLTVVHWFAVEVFSNLHFQFRDGVVDWSVKKLISDLNGLWEWK